MPIVFIYMAEEEAPDHYACDYYGWDAQFFVITQESGKILIPLDQIMKVKIENSDRN